MTRFTPDNLRAALWTWRAARKARGSLRTKGIDGALDLPKVPLVAASSEKAVRSVLRRTGQTCLVRAKVLQAFRSAHGSHLDLIIGVTAPSKGFKAHAWLEGEPPCHDEGFTELLRRPPLQS